MRVSLSNIILLLVFCSFSIKAEDNFKGVYIVPTLIEFKDSRKAYFIVYNNTENDYILKQKIIHGDNYASSNLPFFVNPPIRLIKKGDNVTIGIIYLHDNYEMIRKNKYYLSVSFIPKVKSNKSHDNLSVPIVLTQEIPISFVAK